MTPVHQKLTVAKDGTGDCMNACVASVLDIPIEDAYDVLPGQPGVWFLSWRRWFKARGLSLLLRSVIMPPEGYSIASVETDRIYPSTHQDAGKPISHAVIALDGQIVFDPFPEPYTGPYVIKHYYAILPLDRDDDEI
jgi:hypothetical protein